MFSLSQELFPKPAGKRPALKRKSANPSKQQGAPTKKKKTVKFASQNDSKSPASKKQNKGNKSGKGVQKGASAENANKKKPLTEVDRLKRSKLRKEKRIAAKKRGKRANKPRKC